MLKARKLPKAALAALITAALVATAGVAYAAIIFIAPLAAGQTCQTMSSGTGNGQQLCIGDITPNSGSTSGGTKLTIQGEGFPVKSHTSDYVSTAASNLVMHLDAINNNNQGDTSHSTTTTSWKDLSGHGNNCNLNGGYGYASGGSLISRTLNTDYAWQPRYLDTNMGSGLHSASCGHDASLQLTDNFTVQITLKNVTDGGNYAPIGRNHNQSYYINSSNGSFTFHLNRSQADGQTQSVAAAMPVNSLKTLTLTATPDTAHAGRTTVTQYVDGAKVGGPYTNYYPAKATWTASNIGMTDLFLGANTGMKGPQVFSARVYNRALTADEITNNSVVDQNRFIAPMIVKVGTKECLSPEVVSATVVTCYTPPDTSTLAGMQDVSITFGGKTVTKADAFSYSTTKMTSISPAVGAAAGNSTVTINGTNFPYVQTSDYVQNGLVMHLDAIDNLGLGDKNHSSTTTTWVDLTGNGSNCLLNTNQTIGTHYQWNANELDASSGGIYSPCGNVPQMNISGALTMEAVASKKVSGNQTFFGKNYLTSFYQNMSGNVFTFHINRNQNGENGTGLETPFPINTLSTLSTTMDANKKISLYANGILGGSRTVSSFPQANQGTFYLGGGSANGGNLFASQMKAVRIYNRALSAGELLSNSVLDQKRFLNPPQIRFGTTAANATACTNLVIVSSTRITCKTPAKTAGTYNVYLFQDTTLVATLPNAYQYAATSATYVNSTSPASGPSYSSGQILTINGNEIGSAKVDKVLVGNTQCPFVAGQQSSTVIKCTIPAGQSGSTDIKLYKGSTQLQTLVGAFEYVSASDDPVSYKVERTSALTSAAVYKLNGTTVEAGWSGISRVVLTYPNGFNTITAPSGWTATQTTSTGVKITTLESTIPQTSANVQTMLAALTWTATTTDITGDIKVQLVNGLW